MKLKKLLALITATTLVVLSTSTAFADVTDLDAALTPIESDAVVNYLDPTSVIKIVVPTSASLAITLDPQDLAATQGVGTWNPSGGGTILPTAVGIFANKSAIPVKTTINFTLTDDANSVVLVPNADTINDGTDPKMHLTISPSKSATTIAQAEIEAAAAPVFLKDGENPKVFTAAELTAAGVAAGDIIEYSADAAANAGFGKFVETAADADTYNQVEVPAHGVIAATADTTVSAFQAMADATNAVSMGESGASLAYAMNKADYFVKKTAATTYSLVYDGAARNDNYDTASFVVGGSLNKNADWSAYDADTKITLTATYSFDILTDATYGDAIDAKLTGSYNSLETVAPELPSLATSTFAVDADTTTVAVAVTPGTGSAAVTGVTSVTYEDSGAQSLTVTEDYTYSGNTLTFTEAYVDELIAGEVASRSHTVTFNTGATVTVTLTYSAPVPDVAATVVTEAINFSKTTGGSVTVDLGSGASAATGITSLATVTTGDFAWEAGWWSFNAETKVITLNKTAGISAVPVDQTRNIKVTFNTGATDTFVATIKN